jgi:hypothetical protein
LWQAWQQVIDYLHGQFINRTASAQSQTKYYALSGFEEGFMLNVASKVDKGK